jgi:glycerate kinase
VSHVAVVTGHLGAHFGAAAVAEAAQRGLERAGCAARVAALPLGEPGTILTLVRRLGGRVFTEASGRDAGVRWALLRDGTAVVDRSVVGDRSTAGLGAVLKAARRMGARKILVCSGSVRDTDLGRGLLQALGVTLDRDQERVVGWPENPWPADIPITLLYVWPPTVPVLGARARRWLESLRRFAPVDPTFRVGELGPALAALGAAAEPAAPHLARLLRLDELIRGADWVLTAGVLSGSAQAGGVLPWVARESRLAGRAAWALVPEIGKGYETLYRAGPIGIYPLVDRPQSWRHMERRLVTLVERAAFRLGVFMAGAGGRRSEP